MVRSQRENMVPDQADIVVLSVIPPELRSTLSAFKIPLSSRIKESDGTVYFHGQIYSHLVRRHYGVAVSIIGQAGNASSAVGTTRAIHRFRPKAIVLVGIAGGIRGKTKIGQAILSER